MFGCTDRPDEPGSLQTQCAPPGARQADTAGPGEPLLDWTKDHDLEWGGPGETAQRDETPQTVTVTKDPTHIRHGRGVPQTGQLLPRVRSTRAGVQIGRVVTPGSADDTYPTLSR